MKPVTRLPDPPTRNFFSDDDDDDDDTGLLHGGPPRRGYYGDYSFEFHPNPTSQAFDSAEFSDGLTAQINRRMNEHAAVLLRSVERLSSHVSRMENRTRQLEDAFDDLKESVRFYQGKTDGQLLQLQNVLTEVHDGVKDLRDKQDIAVTQLHLAEIHKSAEDSQSGKKTSTIQTCSSDQKPSSISQQVNQTIYHHSPTNHGAASAAQPPLHPPASFNMAAPASPQYAIQPSPPQQQYYQPLSNFPPESGHHQIVPVPQTEQPSYYPQQRLTMVDAEVNYQTSQQRGLVPSATLSGRSSHHHQQTNRGTDQVAHSYGYGASSSPSSGRQRSRLPTAKLLPRAIPTAASVEEASSATTSRGNICRMPVDDVIDKVVAMGFRRDLVRATVKVLTENGQAVDLNVVLDKLMNSK
ncbi:hypothetical protein LINGRAHAP2_LOCUS16402 [Linum grandiflorum]